MSRPTHSHALLRRAFTLTELLVVIAIIAVLAALASAGVMVAMSKARQTRIKVELDQIDTALKAYKEKYGSYPPSNLGFDNPNLSAPEQAALLGQIRQHIAMAFPRYDLSNLQADLRLTELDTENFRPDQTLYFFLRGFGTDPQHPFYNLQNEQIVNGTIPTAPTKVQVAPFFEFDTTRLAAVDQTGTDRVRTDHMPSYFPAGVTPGTTGAPYLYWDARAYPDSADATKPKHWFNSSQSPKGSPGHSGTAAQPLYSNAGIAVPYWLDTNGNNVADVDENWANPDSYQLIAAGGDRKFGTQTNPPSPTDETRFYPQGFNYDLAGTDDDNVTNFTNKAKLGDDKP